MNAFHRKTLQNRKAVVTGGTGNLGSAIAVGLAAAGAEVIVTGRDQERLEGVLAAMADTGRTGHGYEMDADDPDAMAECADEIASTYGPISILVNGIGGNDGKATTSDEQSFFNLAPDRLAAVMSINWMSGAVLPSQAFGKHMIRNEDGGVIINISSMAALRPLTRVAAYSSSKAAVENFTRWLAVHLAQEYSPAIRVNAIAPGFVMSDQNRYLLQTEGGALTERGEAIVAHTPMARFAEASDVIGAVVWLASDAARFVTGIVVPVDGGFSAFAGV